MSRYQLHPAVPAEIEAAAEWYEQRSHGLGEEFLGAAEDAIAFLAETPARFPRWPQVPPELGVRRYLLRRFPYAIAYVGDVGSVVVLAVAHTRREPLYWMARR